MEFGRDKDVFSGRTAVTAASGRGRWLLNLVQSKSPRGLDKDVIGEIFAMRPLTDDMVQRLNADLAVDDLAEDIAQIGYPWESA